jgi:hypothetical protein
VLFVTIRATWQQLPATSGFGRFVCDLAQTRVNRRKSRCIFPAACFGVVRLATAKLSTTRAPGAGQHRLWCPSAPDLSCPGRQLEQQGSLD